MSTYTIGETAERSGFSPSALRYYEGIGLVEPTARTDAGYRVYDDASLTRLAFIARAKQLGCSLDDITDLVAIWDGEKCGPVQRRFHDLVSAKINDAHRQVAELTALTDQLHVAAAQLSGPPTDGACGDACACVAVDAAPAIACTLQPGAVDERITDWQGVLAHAVARTELSDGALRVEFDQHLKLGELTELVAAEQRCCAFFAFAITIDSRGTALQVNAPADAKEIVTQLFGA